MTLTPGTVLENRYRIDALLGEGGMGAVYRAWHLGLDQPVAVKENRMANPASGRQFAREAKMMARLRHPNLPRVIDHFVLSDGAQYLAMEFIEGDDLGQILQRSGPVDERRALAWVDQVCDALVYLHSQSPPIIHRDIKPDNVKITPRGEVYLVDFGIAKVGDSRQRTMTGAVGVTPGFSPPEQHGTGGTDARSDVYSVGATLYTLVTGCVPPDGVQRLVKTKTLVPPLELCPGLSPSVAAAISAAMNTAPTGRPQTVAAFRALLRAGAGTGRQSVFPDLVQPEVRGREARPRSEDTVVLAPGARRPEALPAKRAATPSAKRRRAPAWVVALGGAAGLLLCAAIVVALLPGLRAMFGPDAATPATPVPALVPSAIPSQTPAPASRPTPSLPTEEPSPLPPTKGPTATSAVEALSDDTATYKAGMVTDVQGLHDGSFNAVSWRGMQMAEQELGVEVAYLESRQEGDYAVNMGSFVDDGYDIIVTVGFLLGPATAKFAAANPDVDFAIVDFVYNPPIDNALALTFAVDEAAFLAGYLSAGMTQTGVVGTFGGMDIPAVTVFMEAFKNGVEHHNQEVGTEVLVLGMEMFVGDFVSQVKGRQFAEDLIAQGVDIVMPAAGPVGRGAAEVAQQNPGTMFIGVDTDWCVSEPALCDVTLTSVMKNVDVAVVDAIRRSKEGSLRGSAYLGTLDNGGVGLAGFHEFADDVPVGLKRALDRVRRDLSSRALTTGWPPGR